MNRAISRFSICLVLFTFGHADAAEPTSEQVDHVLATLRGLVVSDQRLASYKHKMVVRAKEGRSAKAPKTGAYRFGSRWNTDSLREPNLKLVLDDLKIGKQELDSLSVLPNIETITLSKCDLTHESLTPLPSFKGLKSLSISWWKEMTDSDLETISRISSLESLKLFACTKITDEGISHLAKLPNLKLLRIEGGSFTGSGLDGLVHLEYLGVRSVKHSLSPAFAESLLKMKSLKKLSLHHTHVSGFMEGLEKFHATHPDCVIGGEHWRRAYSKKYGRAPCEATKSGESSDQAKHTE